MFRRSSAEFPTRKLARRYCRDCYLASRGQGSSRRQRAGMNRAEHAVCQDCGKGQYQVQTGQASCESCGTGQYQTSRGKCCSGSGSDYCSTCADCPAGRYKGSGCTYYQPGVSGSNPEATSCPLQKYIYVMYCTIRIPVYIRKTNSVCGRNTHENPSVRMNSSSDCCKSASRGLPQEGF